MQSRLPYHPGSSLQRRVNGHVSIILDAPDEALARAAQVNARDMLILSGGMVFAGLKPALFVIADVSQIHDFMSSMVHR